MDARLTAEQRALREAAAELADDLGPRSLHDLDDAARLGRLEKAVGAAGWRTLRADGASGVEIALAAEEFARRLVDVPFLGPVLAADLLHGVRETDRPWALGVDGEAVDAAGLGDVLVVEPAAAGQGGVRTLHGRVGAPLPGADLTRRTAGIDGPLEPVGEVSPERAGRWHALALVLTTADLLGAARGAHAEAVAYAKVREQYGHSIGSYQAVAHPLAEGLALIEGSVSVLRHAAWAVDELPPDEAVRAARVAKLYTARAARTVCETAIQVHGGIGNTWECLVHVFLRRVLVSTELFPARLEELDLGLS